MEEKLSHAIERMGLTGKDKRTPIAEALPVAGGRSSMSSKRSTRSSGRNIAGAYGVFARRLPISISSSHPWPRGPSWRSSCRWRESADVIGQGETKTSVLTSKGLQIDLRIVEPDQFGAACQYFTGSKAHNIKLRQRAMDRGWLLNEYGLSDGESGKSHRVPDRA